jgi:hypothetical protein
MKKFPPIPRELSDDWREADFAFVEIEQIDAPLMGLWIVKSQWMIVHEKLVAEDGWIMDGDLGPYDVVEVRLRAADTVIFLDFSFLCCARRAIRRSRERIDFWWWILAYSWESRPALMKAIADYAPNAKLQVFRDPEALNRFVADAARELQS